MRPALAMLWLLACRYDEPATPPPQPPVVPAVVHDNQLKNPPRPAQLSHVTIKALGMYCEDSCPMRVRYALADLEAVYELGFDPANESIFVSYDTALGAPKQVTKPMIVAIKNAGFDPWLAKESWPDDAKVQVVPRRGR
jgi:hypothetical protein